MDDYLLQYSKELEEVKKAGNLRNLQTLPDACFEINLSSNDYLGISKKNIGVSEEKSLGSGSSRLLVGNCHEYDLLEDELENLYGQSALFFNSGYHANIGILPALAKKGDLILSDKLNHASIVDGIQLSKADNFRFKHADYEHLEQIIKKKRKRYKRVFIVSESVFSMDGDEANLQELLALKKKYNCFLYLDEAHALGVRGKKGLGLAEEKGVVENIDLLVGTFGKAMNSIGAFVISNPIVKSYLINKMRSLIFTTSLPSALIYRNLLVLRKVLAMQNEREYLKQLSEKLRSELKSLGIQTGGSSNIVPVIVGDSKKCVNLVNFLQKKKNLVFPIRPPSVPQGTSRLRLSICADMTWEDLKKLPKWIKEYDHENTLVT